MTEEFTTLRKTFWEVFTFIEQRRIFLPQSVCELVDRHLGTMRRTVIKAGVYGGIEYPTTRTAEQIQRALQKRTRSWKLKYPPREERWKRSLEECSVSNRPAPHVLRKPRDGGPTGGA